ncbi:unnamed protein product, partial [Prunus brigantina]
LFICRARLPYLSIKPKISGGITSLRDGFTPRRARFIKTEYARRIVSFVAQDSRNFQKNRDSLLSSSRPLSALNTLSLRRHSSPVPRRKKDRAATTVEAQSFPRRHRRRFHRKKLRLADSAPPVFSLLQPPIPTPEMSDLIRHRRSVTTTPSSEPPAWSASAATAPALMVELPGVSQAPASSASSVAQPVSARPASTTDTTSTDGTVASGSQPGIDFPSTVMAKVTRVTNSRISIGYDEHHRVAPTAELHSSLAHDVGHVVRTHCPMH